MKIETDEEILARHDPAVRARAKIELEIVHELIKRLRAAGYVHFEVDDGGDDEEDVEGDQEIVHAIFAVDEAYLLARRTANDRASKVFLVMGNSGYDVISDYTLSLETVMEPLSEWITKTYGY